MALQDIWGSLKEFLGGNQKIHSPIPENMPLPTATPTPSFMSPDDVQQGVMDFYMNQMPPSMRDSEMLQEYYPLGEQLPNLVQKGEAIRPGMGALAGLTAFLESTGGRLSDNLFGGLPGGEGSGKSVGGDYEKQFETFFVTRLIQSDMNFLIVKKHFQQ